MKKRDDTPPGFRPLRHSLLLTVVEHVAPSVVYQIGEAVREHLAAKRTPKPK